MKAVTVAGGSSEQSGPEQKTVPEAEPDTVVEDSAEADSEAEAEAAADSGSVEDSTAGPDEAEDTAPAAEGGDPEDTVVPDDLDATAEETPKAAGAADGSEADGPETTENDPEAQPGPDTTDNAGEATTAAAEAEAAAESDSVEDSAAGPDEAEDTAPAAEGGDRENAVVPDDLDGTAEETPKAAGAADGSEADGPETTENEPEAEPGPDVTDNAEETGAEPDAPTAGGAGTAAETGPADRDDAEASAAPAGPPPRVPSWARGAESDSEKTSQFVALKPLDTPAPAPAPAPTPTAPPAGAGAKTAAPLPPLELLAELTNTAPPPETPRRTALRRVKVWTPILLLLAGAFTGAQLLRPLPAPTVVAAEPDRTLDGQFSIPWPAKGQGAVRVPGSGDIGTFGEQKPVPTASVAKVMTAYVILKNHPLRKADPGPSIEVDAKAVADGTSEHESRIEGLTAGTKFSQQDMLKMLMIPSGNNVARLLARWDTGTGSETAFVEKMNAAAKELGMRDTTYTDPSGLDAGTVSTAADQLKLAEAVMKDEAFRAIVALPSATIKGLPQPIINNNDTLLTAQGLSIRGIKTGSSTPAGGALMWAAYKSVGDETPLILGTLMDQHVEGPDPDGGNSLILVKANSKKIIEAVREALASAPVVRKGQQVGYVDDGLGGRTPLVATKDLNVVGVPGQRLKLTLGTGAAPVPHTAKAGAEIGVLTAGDGDGAKSVPVAVQGDLAEPSFVTRLTRLG
ncbi:serine hydrolase [Streptomyces sp. NPDC048258]|uniref:D-alanyl-D-alanine carboxypeptidase n=1 Tax=Streptomyces sp. NPDC048258 TaxID=3365527 RepID=UPI0037210FFE